MKTVEETKAYFINLGACEEARVWAEGKTAKEAWEQCPRGDWLLWWARNEGVGIREINLAKGKYYYAAVASSELKSNADIVRSIIKPTWL